MTSRHETHHVLYCSAMYYPESLSHQIAELKDAQNACSSASALLQKSPETAAFVEIHFPRFAYELSVFDTAIQQRLQQLSGATMRNDFTLMSQYAECLTRLFQDATKVHNDISALLQNHNHN